MLRAHCREADTGMESSNTHGKRVAIVGGGLVGNTTCLLFVCAPKGAGAMQALLGSGWLLGLNMKVSSKLLAELEREGLWKGSSSTSELVCTHSKCNQAGWHGQGKTLPNLLLILSFTL